jgi:hypothetical protein
MDKRLLGNSLLQFDCLLFPNGIYHQHWNIMAVFPKERMIVALDSMRIGSVKDARIIFRRLYDETSYNHPADVKYLFSPFQPDLGWRYMVDKQLAFQHDGYNCGVFMIGYFHCLLFGMNPRRLTAPLMTEYRQRIFAAMHGAKVKVYPPSPWQELSPEKHKQAPLPALTPAVSRSIAKKRRQGTSSTGSHLLNFDQFRENATALRKERAAQQQERRDERALKVEADRVRQKARDAIAKIQEQNIKKANAKVNILLRGDC